MYIVWESIYITLQTIYCLREHKFRQNFKVTLNPLCSCITKAETTLHFFLCFQFLNVIREILKNGLIKIYRTLSPLNQNKLVNILLCESDTSDNATNCKIPICTLKFAPLISPFSKSLLINLSDLLIVLRRNVES